MSEPAIPKPCVGCRHLNGFAQLEADKGEVIITGASVVWACEAFPSGIPEAIRENRRSHRKPAPGDRGIRFEPL